jgi:4-oxalocrotonate tautomerase family enzyme
MPTATFDGPPIRDLDKKRALTKEVTDAMERAYGIPRSEYVVVIKENPPENVSVGGELLADRIARRRAEKES